MPLDMWHMPSNYFSDEDGFQFFTPPASILQNACFLLLDIITNAASKIKLDK